MDLILDYIAGEMKPISTIEKPTFQKMLKGFAGTDTQYKKINEFYYILCRHIFTSI